MAVGEVVLQVLDEQPGKTMAYEPLCLALRVKFFGQLKRGDYDKSIKQLYAEKRIHREKNGQRPKLNENEMISLRTTGE